MALDKVEGVFVKGDFYLEPVNSVRIDRDGYLVSNKILASRYHVYRANPPLLFPLMRGGGRAFLNISGHLRRVLRNGSQDIDYVPIRMSRYTPSEIGGEGVLNIDQGDIMQAFYALQRHSEGIIIDDVFDKGLSASGVQELLRPSGKPISIATTYRKPEENRTSTNADFYAQDFGTKSLGGRAYRPWLVFPWEIDDHDKETWAELFPEFADVHPEHLVLRA